MTVRNLAGKWIVKQRKKNHKKKKFILKKDKITIHRFLELESSDEKILIRK